MSTKPDRFLKYGAQAVLDMGRPVKCGDLWRPQRSWIPFVKKKKWQSCYVILAQDRLLVFDNKNSNEAQSASHVSSLECAKSNGQENIDGENVCFIVRFEEVNKDPLIFACDVEKTRQKWINSINEEIKNVKKFSADSAYASGGSLSNYPSDSTRYASNENENNYYEIDEANVTTNAVSTKQTELDETGRPKKDEINTQNAVNAYSGLPKTVSKAVATRDSDTKQRVKMASRHTGQPNDTIVQQLKSKQSVSDQQDSGFLNVGIHSSLTTVKTLHTRLEGVDSDGTSANTPRMQYLKMPVPESNSALNNDENSQNIYENRDFATYSNVDELSFDLTKHFTSPSAPVYRAARQTTKPKVATKPAKRLQTDPQRDEMAAQSSSMDPVQDSAHLLVGILSSSTEAKTHHETRDGELNEDTSENIHFRSQNPKLQRSESRVESSMSNDSNSSEESTIYENTNFDKVFERDDYICEQRKVKHLKTEPIGTFCVRPGDETKQELAIQAEDRIYVFRIHEKNGRVYLNENIDFSSLDKLLSHYSYTELPSRTIKVTLKRGYNSNT